MKHLEQKIRELAESALENADYFLVDVVVSGGPSQQKVTVLVDGDHGVDIDVCASISRKLSVKIDELGLIDHKFLLEVSSPGIDYPLTSLRQIKKNIGRNIKVFLKGNKTIEGKLYDANIDHICIRKESIKEGMKEHKLSLEEIEKIKVQVSFK